MLGGPWIPAFAGKTMIHVGARSAPFPAFRAPPCFFFAFLRLPFRFLCESRGPGAAMVPLSRNGPQCSEFSAGTMSGFSPFSFPLRKQGPRNRGGAAVTEQTSVQWNFRRHDARVLLKEQHAPCRGDRGGSMSSWPPPRAPWSLDPGVRRENEESRKARGPGAAVMPLSRNRPQCSGFSAGTVLELSLKNSTPCAAEAVVARCPFGCHPELRGPWIPAFVEKAMREREGDEGNRCRILKGAGLGAVGCRRRCILAGCSAVRLVEQGQLSGAVVGQADADAHQAHGAAAAQPGLLAQLAVGRQVWTRSEEHTSELQSRGHLVCRL